MKAKNIIASVLVACLLTVLLPVFVVNAASFPDVEARHSWAQQAIDSMASRNILKGFPDGTFQPDTPITKLDSLIITARILGYSDPSNKQYANAALEAFSGSLSAYDISYKGEVAYLLYWGVLKTTELDQYISASSKSTPLLRHEAAILLTKLMGGEAEALSNTLVALPYADAASIPATSQVYVNYVNEQGIMKGVEDNNFAPFTSVNRAMTATMMYRAEQAMKMETADVTVVSVNSMDGTIEATNRNGVPVKVETTEITRIKIDGVTDTIGSLKTGVNIRLRYQDSHLRLLEAISSNMKYSINAKIEGTASSSSTQSISFTAEGENSTRQLSLADDAAFYIDGNRSSFAAIRQGQYATLKVDGGLIVEVSVETKSKDYAGTIVDLSVGNEVLLTIRTNDDDVVTYGFSDNAIIRRNNNLTEAWSLATGDSVTFTVLRGKITILTANSKSKEIQGTIEGISISSSPSVLVRVAGESKTYKINQNTRFVVDGKEQATIYDLRLDSPVTLKIEGETVATITTNTVMNSPVLVGTVNYIHPTSNVMGIDVVNADGTVSTRQAVVKSSVKITDATSTKITRFADIKVGRSVVAVGTINYGVYEITSITITE